MWTAGLEESEDLNALTKAMWFYISDIKEGAKPLRILYVTDGSFFGLIRFGMFTTLAAEEMASRKLHGRPIPPLI